MAQSRGLGRPAAVIEIGRRAQTDGDLLVSLGELATLEAVRNTRLHGNHGMSLAGVVIMDLIAIGSLEARRLAYVAFDELERDDQALLLAVLHVDDIRDASVATEVQEAGTVTSEDRVTRMRALTRRGHAGQTRNGGRIPYWVHTDGVAQLCGAALRASRELTPADAEDVVLAAYGHDLFEDTAITPDEIRAEFGERVARWIGDLTNEQSDHDRAEYQRKFANADEEVRLVKCADLADNMLSVAYGLHDVGLTWATQFFLPIADETRRSLLSAPFVRLPITGQRLLDLVDVGWARLVGAMDSASGQPWAQGAGVAEAEG